MRRVAMLLAGTGVGLFVAACEAPPAAHPAREATAAARVASGPHTAGREPALAVGRWQVRVTVRPRRLGPIVVAVEELVRAKPNEARPWIRHGLVLRNTAARSVTFADTRRSAFTRGPGHHRLLAADAGCGYAFDRPTAPVTDGVCQANLDLVSIEPHASARRPVTLFKGLPGMERLRAGTYVFRRAVRFRLGKRAPDVGEGRFGVLSLAYRIESR